MSDTLSPGDKKTVPTVVDSSGSVLRADTGQVLTQDYTTTGPTLVDGSGGTLQQGAGYVPIVYDSRAATFFVAEIETYRAGSVDVLRVSDLGYRTRSTDAGGVQVYPHLMDRSFEIDRRVSLELSGTGTATYGAIRITNLNRQLDAFTLGRNSNSRPVRIKIGQKIYDPERGLFVDPPYSSLKPVFNGTCGSWLINEQVIEIPLKDATYLIDKPIQTRMYLGVGGTEGPETFKGLPKPMTRGGTPEHPVRNVPFKLVDTVYNIWQWTDGPGTVVTLYENSAAVFQYYGDVSNSIDLYSLPTPEGMYRTCNALGLMQLGSTSVGVITGDVTGSCGDYTASQAIMLAQNILMYDLSLPADKLNTASFAYANLAYPYLAGFFFDAETSGLAVVSRLVGSVGGRLLSSRSGAIGVFVPPRTQLGAIPSIQLNDTNIISVNPVALPQTIDPPPYRWRVSYQTCYSVQQTGYNPTISEDRKQFVANPFRYALWYGADVQVNWLKPNDPSPIETYLLRPVQAQALADTLGDQWRSLPDYYEIVVPVTVAFALDIGSYVEIKWPLGILNAGAIGQIFGEQPRTTDNVVTFEVLVNTSGLTEDQFLNEFILDVSLLNVGVLGGGTTGTTLADFYLDVSLLDEASLASGGTLIKSTLTPTLNGGVSSGSSTLGQPSGASNAFYLDISYLDVGVLGDGTAVATTPPITTTTTPPVATAVTFTLDVSLLDVDLVG